MKTEMHRSPVSLSFKRKYDVLSSSCGKELPAIQYSYPYLNKLTASTQNLVLFLLPPHELT